MNHEWTPLFEVELIDVIRLNSIHALQVGQPEAVVVSSLGEPELPAAKVSKKSTMVHYTYGNVTVIVEHGDVIAMDIDLHGNRQKVVHPGIVATWGLKEWQSFAEDQGWSLEHVHDIVQIRGEVITLGLSLDGKIGMVSMR
ncbi:hypothetical protein [Paenibacillus massiliensis]|uniref:hypothetical protein n=1 Tax=Paenibacillus massiliensis TaxID=225917 RepID=UPI00037A877F|nr:hypothetical protein [Paenibacillus massiliensis]